MARRHWALLSYALPTGPAPRHQGSGRLGRRTGEREGGKNKAYRARGLPSRPSDQRREGGRKRLTPPRNLCARPRRRGRRSDGMGFFGPGGSPLPSFPRARERGASGWARGASGLGGQRCGHGHAGKPQACGRCGLAGGEGGCPGAPRKVRETRRGDGIASRDTVPPDTLI